MSVSAEAEIALELDGDKRVPILLFAGGTTGLVLLATTERQRSFCLRFGELAESHGLSALAFAGDVGADPAIAALRGGELLKSLGVEQAVLVAFGDGAPDALHAASTTFAALVLVEPLIPQHDIEVLLAHAPIAKLVVVRGNDAVAQKAAASLFRHAIGPIVIRHLPADDLAVAEAVEMVAETTIRFTIGVCGGRRPE